MDYYEGKYSLRGIKYAEKTINSSRMGKEQ